MHVAVLTWGSRGDVQPLLALAKRLAAEGTRVTFGAPPAFGEWVRAHGIAFAPLGTPIELGAYRRLLDVIEAEPNPRKQNRFLLQQVLLPDLERLFGDCLHAARGAHVVVGHWLQLGAGLAAEALGIPWVSVTLHPSGIQCEQSLAERATDQRARESYSNWLWGDRVERFRAQRGLAVKGCAADGVYSDTLNLVAVSRALVPDHAAWPRRHRAVGFFFLDEQADWRPSPALQRFVDRHREVVAVTFSTSAGARLDQDREVVLSALEQTGGAAVIQSPWAEGEGQQSERVFCTRDIPHSWLFPRALCVVHHGGAGTTAAALRAGAPSVVIGHMFDQLFWRNLLAAHGLGPPPIARGALMPAVLAERIEASASCREACRRVAMSIAEEGGVEEAARYLRAFSEETPCASAVALRN